MTVNGEVEFLRVGALPPAKEGGRNIRRIKWRKIKNVR